MNFNQLTHCLFCSMPLTHNKKYSNEILCPNQLSHHNKYVWIWVNHKTFNSVHIQIDKYQFDFYLSYNLPKTEFTLSNNQGLPKSFDCILEMELTEQAITNKMEKLAKLICFY